METIVLRNFSINKRVAARGGGRDKIIYFSYEMRRNNKFVNCISVL